MCVLVIVVYQVICSPAGNSLQIIVKRREISTLGLNGVLIEGDMRNIFEKCKVESSAYECIDLDIMDKRSLMIIRNNVGD